MSPPPAPTPLAPPATAKTTTTTTTRPDLAPQTRTHAHTQGAANTPVRSPSDITSGPLTSTTAENTPSMSPTLPAPPPKFASEHAPAGSVDVAPALSAQPSNASMFAPASSNYLQPPTMAPPLPPANTLALDLGPSLVPTASMIQADLIDADMPSRAPQLPPTPVTAAIFAPPPALPDPDVESEILPAEEHPLRDPDRSTDAITATGLPHLPSLPLSPRVRKSPYLTSPAAADGYTGYIPKSAADFYFLPPTHAALPPHSITPPEADDVPLAPPQRADLRQQSRLSLAVAILAALVALIFGIVLLTPAHCNLGLCDKRDRASLSDAPYNLRVLSVPAPLRLIAVTVCVASLCIAALAAMIARLARASPPPHNAGQLFAHVRPAATRALRDICAVVAIAFIALFVFTGLAASWRAAIAGVFGLGAVLIAPSVVLAASVRTTPRIVTALTDTAAAAMQLAARLGTVASLAGAALALLAVSLAYLTTRDARAMIGAAAAASGGAFMVRLAATTYANVPSDDTDGGEVDPDNEDDSVDKLPPSTSWKNPAVVSKFIGPQLAAVAAHSAQTAALFTVALVAPVVLSLSQPYFADNAFAMCVFNHLGIDRECVAYGVPKQKLSFAVSLCRVGDFYKAYPTLSPRHSNAMFIALPFLLAAAGVVATAITGALFPVRALGQTDDQVEDAADAHDIAAEISKRRPYTRAAWANMIIAGLIVTSCAAGFCFGIFGPGSAFGQVLGSDMAAYSLSTTGTDRCRPTMALAGSTVDDYPALSRGVAAYRPITGMGATAPHPNSIGWRLFLCVLAGQAAAMLCGGVMTLFCAPALGPASSSASAVAYGIGNAVLDATADSALAAVFGTCITATAAFGAHRLMGAYGVGLAALGGATMCATSGGLSVAHDVLEQAGRTCATGGSGDGRALTRAGVLRGAATGSAAFGAGTTAGAGGLCAAALWWVVAEASGVGVNIRDVVGGIDAASRPTRHVTDLGETDVSSPFAIGALMGGVWMGALLCGVVLFGLCRVATRVAKEVRRQVREGDGPIRRAEAKPEIEVTSCIRVCAHGALAELPVGTSIALMWTVAIGLLLGQGGVIATVCGLAGGGTALSMALVCAGRRLGGGRGQPVGSSGLCVSGAMVAACAIGAVTCEVVWSDERKAWIGALAAALWLWAALTAAWVSKNQEDGRRKQDRVRKARAEIKRGAIGDVLINARAVSPFFEHGPRLVQGRMDPRSPLHGVAETGLAPELAKVEGAWGVDADEEDEAMGAVDVPAEGSPQAL